MPDCFISYSTKDAKLAQFVHDQLTMNQIDTFMAPISIKVGTNWTSAIWENLNSANWIIFLASSSACASPFVQQELGGGYCRKEEHNTSCLGYGARRFTRLDFSPSSLGHTAWQHSALGISNQRNCRRNQGEKKTISNYCRRNHRRVCVSCIKRIGKKME